MKTKIAFIAISLLLGARGFGISAEHPEHPEHPAPKQSKGHEHPKEQPDKGARKAFQNDFEKFVKDHVASEAQKTGGVYTIHDDAAKKDWKLELVKVHKDKICMLQEGRSCFACADFKEAGGKNRLDLDFYAAKSEDGTLTMEKVLIHKVNGKRRFTYDKDNNMVPMK